MVVFLAFRNQTCSHQIRYRSCEFDSMDSTVEPSKPEALTAQAETRISTSRRAQRLNPDLLVAAAFVGDVAIVIGGLIFGFWLRFESGWINFGILSEQMLSDYWGLICVGAGFLLLAFGHLGLYDKRNLLRFRQVMLITFKAATFWLFAYLGVSLMLKFQPPISRIYVICSYLAVFSALLFWRYVLYSVLKRENVAEQLRQRILFLGWNAEAERLTNAIDVEPGHPYEIIGCLPPSEGFKLRPPPNVPMLGELNRLPNLLQHREADIVVLADLDWETTQIMNLADLCEKEFVQFKVIPSYFQILVSGLQLDTISGVPILGISQLPLDRLTNRILKRTVDLVGASAGLILCAPVMAILGAIIYLESPGPIFYRQVRTGRNGRDFEIIKLRSMRLDAETDGGVMWAKKDDPRRLRIGAFMREWNLDEIPQFWNVLKGEMSLVGPRPERPELIAKFKHQIPHYNARHASKPGITGWAQVNGLRGDTDLAARIRYDLFYLENWGLWLDFQIMAQTFFKRDNAY
jgi:exopolysaccharide biosynthesis polyprenyl glycosylphosphotransferase